MAARRGDTALPLRRQWGRSVTVLSAAHEVASGRVAIPRTPVAAVDVAVVPLRRCDRSSARREVPEIDPVRRLRQAALGRAEVVDLVIAGARLSVLVDAVVRNSGTPSSTPHCVVA